MQRYGEAGSKQPSLTTTLQTPTENLTMQQLITNRTAGTFLKPQAISSQT
jgi:hypothetical protein